MVYHGRRCFWPLYWIEFEEASRMKDTPQTFNQPPHSSSNRWTLIVFFLVFTVPVLAAYFALYSGWWQKQGSTEHGQLLTPPLIVNDLALRNKQNQLLDETVFRKRWWLIYIAPQTCDEACKNTQFLMQQIKIGLGADQNRLHLWQGQGAAQAEGQLYIMDPLGQIMLRYPTYADPKESVLKGRGILKDLQKLFKVSHIG